MPSSGLFGVERSEGNSASKKGVSFKELLFICLLYWPLFLGLLVLSLAAAWLYLQIKPPLYETKAAILIKDEKKGSYDVKAVDAMNLFASKRLVENEVEVLKSNTLIQQVVRDLHLYAAVFEEGKFVDRDAYLSSPVQIIVEHPEQIKEVRKTYFVYHPAQQQVVVGQAVYPLNRWIKGPDGSLKFVSNPNRITSTRSSVLYFTLSPLEKVTNDILERLNVAATNKLSTVLELSLQDAVAQRGEDILNQLMAQYNKETKNDKTILAANTLAFIDDRLKYLVHDLDSIEGKLQHFKSRNSIVDIGTEGKLFLETVGANDQKINDINMHLAILNQVESYVAGKGSKGGIVPSTFGVADPVLSGLLDKLYNAELEYEKTRKIAPENHPFLVSLSDQINKIKPSILENIQNQKRSLLAGKNDLAVTNNKYTSQLQTIPYKERELLEISRQQTIKNNIYTYLLQKREEAALSYSSAIGDSHQVDQAQSGEFPVSPKKRYVYFVAVMAAFSLGYAGVFAKKGWNNRVELREELQNYIKGPVVGELVYMPTRDTLVVNNGKQSLIAEQFRQIRTSLGYLVNGTRTKKILITSSISGEGKSFIAANIAASLALTGKRVILLELDLRKPDLVTYPAGITDYLRGEKSMQELLQGMEVSENLFVIPAGSIPPNPSELLTNGKIEALLAYLDTRFDYVIIDSSPVVPVTDAYLLSPLCDATLYVIRQGVTPRAIIQMMGERFQTKALKNVAVIFNGIKGTGLGKYYYGYSYHYKYVSGRKGSEKRKGFREMFS